MPTRLDPATGGLIFIPQEKDNEVIIKSVDDIPTTVSSDKVYFIDGFIDIGALEIIVPTGGMYISGHGYGISGLFSTENNHTMFKTGGGTYAGDFIVNGCTFYTTGTSSKLFSLDNDGNNSACEFNACNLGSFSVTTTSLGSITAYRQFRTGDFAAIKYTDGFTFNGSFSGIAFNDSILLSNVAGTTFLQEGVSLLITDGMSSNMNALSLDSTSEWCDFQSSNFDSSANMTLSGFRTAGTDPLPNMDATNIRSLFKGCTGIDNTFIGGSWSVTTEAETTVGTADTLVKIAGITTTSLDGHFSSSTNNRLQYDGVNTIKVDIDGYMQLETSGTESLVVTVRQWDNSASSWIDLQTFPLETQLKLLGDRRGSTGISTIATLETGDYIELWAKNVSNTNNYTILLGGTIKINQRGD